MLVLVVNVWRRFRQSLESGVFAGSISASRLCGLEPVVLHQCTAPVALQVPALGRHDVTRCCSPSLPLHGAVLLTISFCILVLQGCALASIHVANICHYYSHVMCMLTHVLLHNNPSCKQKDWSEMVLQEVLTCQ